MIARLALRNLTLRPGRTLFLLVGYGLGVAVMIVLLSVGEALVTQARDERLVGGGAITVLPAGVDVEVLKTGGLGGMFFSIDHARFLNAQLLAAPRMSGEVAAVAPQIEGKLLYARLTDGRVVPVLASGELPSRTAMVGGMPPLSAGEWGDDGDDRAWRDPLPDQLRNAIDHFHLPPPAARRDSTWAEWHYFNVLSSDNAHWAFISLIVGGQVPDGRWGGQVLVTLHGHGEPDRRFVMLVPSKAVRFSTYDANVTLGASSVTVLDDGRYAVRAHAADPATGAPVDVNLVVDPAPGAYFPGAELASDSATSGYVVPALRAAATGTICVAARCEHYDGAQSYHDHNWGTWRGVTWEWGAARAGPYTLLYGRIQPADSAAATQPLFAYLVDSLGFVALFRPQEIQYLNTKTLQAGGAMLRVPSRGTMYDARGDDTLRIQLDVEDATAADTRVPSARGPSHGRGLARPYFIQMKGTMTLSGRINGKPVSGAGEGFFETYR